MSLLNFDISLLQLYRLDLVQSTSNVLIVPALSGTIYFKLLNLTKVFSLVKLYLPSDLLRLSNHPDEISHMTLQIGFLLF
jgi:hypothetical protein